MIGSDQVWNPQISGESIDLSFWGDFTNSKKISIASSSGSYKYTNDDYKKILPLLRDFKSISVRENFLKLQLQKNNIDAQTILDPTLLYGKSNWNKEIMKMSTINLPGEDYIFVYFVITTYKEYRKYIEFLKKELGLKVLLIDRYNIKYDCVDYHIKSATPIDFVNLIKNSTYVLTDSFHGTAFSTIFEKNVSVLKTSNYKRSLNLLETIRADYKMFSNLEDLKLNFERPIDYFSANEILNKKIEEGKNYILDSINI